MLAQETPTVQIVDEPEFPLKKNKSKYSVTALMFMIGFGAIYGLYLIVTRKSPATTIITPLTNKDEKPD